MKRLDRFLNWLWVWSSVIGAVVAGLFLFTLFRRFLKLRGDQ